MALSRTDRILDNLQRGDDYERGFEDGVKSASNVKYCQGWHDYAEPATVDQLRFEEEKGSTITVHVMLCQAHADLYWTSVRYGTK